MKRSAKLLPIYLLIATSTIEILTRIGIGLWGAFVASSSPPPEALRAADLFFQTVPGYLMLILSAFALGTAGNNLRMHKFEDKSTEITITILASAVFIQAFTKVFRVI